MCGIVGYTGAGTAKDRLLSGLMRLEYRGYDSSGISVFNENGQIETYKTLGRIAALKELVKDKIETANCGIGHTRWATHGIPSDINAHPHYTEKLSLVHNGIIENYLELKEFLLEKGYTFVSQTDTEIAAKYLDYHYNGDVITAIRTATAKMKGAYAFAIIFSDKPNEIFATRNGSPLVVTQAEDSFMLASDMPAVLEFTNKYYTIDTGDIAHLTAQAGVHFYDKDGNSIEKQVNISNLSFEQAEKDGYEHYMLKEIYEQPKALKRTISPRVSAEKLPDFTGDNIDDSFFNKFSNIYIVACGTAYYAGSLGGQMIRQIANVNVRNEIASEFRYSPPVITSSDLVILASQSGETADTLAALRLAKEKGVTTLAVVNVAGSAIALEADYVIYTHAGPEIAVASTKAFTVQVATFYLFAIKLALATNVIDEQAAKNYVCDLVGTIDEFADTFSLDKECLEISKTFLDAHSMFYIGRGHDANLSLEGALKLKEISYIHCEAYAAGELKHGTISLITAETPVIAVVTDAELAPKTVSNMRSVRSRGGRVTVITLTDIEIPEDAYDRKMAFDCTAPIFAPLKAVVPLQLLAYHTSWQKGCDVDKPRNLAKSVTVE